MRAPLSRSAMLVTLLVARGALADPCVRPTDPGGFEGYDYGDATVRSFGNDSVLVWYVESGAHSVRPVSTRDDGVPDDVEEVAEVTSEALASYQAMGYRVPVSDALNSTCGTDGGDGRLDVYLMHMVGADGMTVVEPERCMDSDVAAQCAGFIIAEADFSPPVHSYETPSVGIRTVLPHEVFHAVQNAYDAGLDRFWAEGTAQWAASVLDPSLTDLERFLPAFVDQTWRSLDAPAGRVTSAFLYGAAIWPVFLSTRHGEAIVRSILEREGEVGGPALAATDWTLAGLGSSLATEYALFSAWNAATGTRAGAGGYPHAASYPMVAVSELEDGATHGVSSGLSSYFFHAKAGMPVNVVMNTSAARNVGTLVPLEEGIARLDRAATLPARLDGEGIVVVSGTTTNKTDAPFTLGLEAVEPAAGVDGGASASLDAGGDASAPSGGPDVEAGGCSLAAHPAPGGALASVLTWLGLAGLLRRRRGRPW